MRLLTEEESLDQFIQKRTYEGSRQKGKKKVGSEASSLRIQAGKTKNDGPNPPAINEDHCKNGAALNDDQVGIDRFLGTVVERRR